MRSQELVPLLVRGEAPRPPHKADAQVLIPVAGCDPVTVDEVPGVVAPAGGVCAGAVCSLTEYAWVQWTYTVLKGGEPKTSPASHATPYVRIA